jgi:hypothetical protein
VLLNKILLVILGVRLLAAAPLSPCPTTTLDQYLVAGFTCVGGSSIIYKGFSFSSSVVSGSAVPATAITVTPEPAGLKFSSSFQVTPVDSVTYYLIFAADDPKYGDMDSTLSTNGNNSKSTDVHTTGCVGSTVNSTIVPCLGPSVTLHVFQNPQTAVLFDSASFPTTPLVGVLNTLQFQANGTGPGNISIENDFQVVPEPEAWLSVAIGLGLLHCRFRLAVRRP